MTNVNADSANGRDMSKPDVKMTRDQMQTEAMVIESLLVAAQAIFDTSDPSDALNLVYMATKRASQLNRALDCVNAPNVPS